MHTHEFVDYQAKHLKEAGYPVEKSHHLYRHYPSWSVFCDGALVICGGFITPYEGLAECWTIPGPAFKSHIKLALQSTKDTMAWHMPLGCRRMQAMVIDSHEAGHRWAQHLGFTKESVLRRFGKKGEDVAMYVLFPGGRIPWTAE